MDEIISIRQSTPDDLAKLDVLFARSYPILLRPDYPPSVLVTALPLISRAQPALLRSGTFYVAETSGGSLVGAGGWTARSPQIGDIRHVVTDDRHVRKGIGHAIMSRVFHEASSAGLSTLICNSTRTAVPFYTAMGFVELRRIEVELRPGITFPAVQMQRNI